MSNTTASLSVEGVSVSFGGIRALTDVTLDVEPGRVTGLIGPNGAGKTTLFNVITGLQRPTAGRVQIGDEDISGLDTYQRSRRGIARTFQRVETFGHLTVRDNVLVAAEQNPRLRRSRAERTATVDDLIDRVGLGGLGGQVAGALPTGMARLVELARALATSPKVLLLDEPSSGLNEVETTVMADLLVELTSGGLAALLVEHDMPFVMSCCERIHVLDFGVVIARGSPSEIQRDPKVRAAYLGDVVEVTS